MYMMYGSPVPARGSVESGVCPPGSGTGPAPPALSSESWQQAHSGPTIGVDTVDINLVQCLPQV